MERVEQFRSDFWVTKVGTPKQIEDLKKQILSAKEQNIDPMSMNNDGTWRSNAKYENIDWLGDAIKETTATASEFYMQGDTEFAKHIVEHKIKWDYWTNVNEPGSINVLHTHVADSFTAVYYVQGKDTGALRFVNPANTLNNVNVRSPFSRDCLVFPGDGELVLWPGWIPHEVLRNESDRQRINLAFSIQVS